MIGKSPLSNRILVIIHTYQKIDGNEIVGIISARKSTRKEQYRIRQSDYRAIYSIDDDIFNV